MAQGESQRRKDPTELELDLGLLEVDRSAQLRGLPAELQDGEEDADQPGLDVRRGERRAEREPPTAGPDCAMVKRLTPSYIE